MDLQLMRLRKEAGYKNRKSFAERLGMNEHTYRTWETGETKLTLENACDICDILNCTLDELAGRERPNAARPDEQRLLSDYRTLPKCQRDALRTTAAGMAGAGEKMRARLPDDDAVVSG